MSFEGTNPAGSSQGSYKRQGLDIYPNPYFDPSSAYTPPTIKEMFRWCLFLYLTNSTIGPVIRKKAAYVVTDLTYNSPDKGTEDVYKDIFERTLKIKRFEFLMLLDLEVYGNAFCSILYPFDRYLICPSCKKENLIRTVKWEYDGKRFRTTCKGCGTNAHMEIKDVPVRNRKRLKLQRWNPMYIEPRRNPVSGKVTYVLRIPKWLRQRISDPKINKVYVEDTPRSFLDAIRNDMNIELDPENIYHMKYDSISMEDDSMGIPPILNIMKDVWLLQTYRKGQECVTPDTLIETPRGATPARDVGIGDLVKDYTGVYRKVFDRWERPIHKEAGERAVEIELTSLNIPSTFSDNHPIYVMKKIGRKASKIRAHRARTIESGYTLDFVNAGEIKAGDRIAYPVGRTISESQVDLAKYLKQAHTDEWMYQSSLETALAYEKGEAGGYVTKEESTVAHRALLDDGLSRWSRFRTIDKDLGYIVGWYLGDGSASSRHISWFLGLDDDEKPLVEAIKRYFGVEPKIEVRRNIKVVTLCLAWASYWFKTWLGSRSKKRIPEEIRKGPDDAYLSCLKGLFEADGCLDEHHYALASANRQLSLDAREALLYFGCIPAYEERPRGESVIEGRVIRGGISIHVTVTDASKDRLVALFDGTSAKEVESGKSGFFYKHGEVSYFVARVAKVRDVDEPIVINFSVEETHTFCTLGMATHNSIALDHILPLTLVSPQPSPGSVSPHMNVDLGSWRARMNSIITAWRRDQNALFPVPFPVQVSQVRGDAAALSLHQDVNFLRQSVAGGLDVPADFIYGNLQYCHSLQDGLVATSWGQLYLGELVGKEEGKRKVWFEAPGHEEPGEASFAHNTGVKQSVRLAFELGNEAFPSEDHRYYRLDPETLEPSWVKSRDLKVGDHVAVKAGADCWSCEVPSLTMPEEDITCRDRPLFPRGMTMDLAGLMGGLVAEGSITGKSRVSLGMNDRKVVEDLRDRADRIFGLPHSIYKGPVGDLSDSTHYRFEFDRVLERRFLELNIGTGYAEDKCVPAVIRRSPKQYVFEFLRYLFEGDGGPTKQDVRYASKSSKLVAEVQALLMNAGILGHHYEGTSKTPAGEPVKMHHLVITGVEMVRFKELIGFVSKKKNKRLDQAIERWDARSYDKMSIRDRIPYGREALNRFVEQHRIGKLWAEDRIVPANLPAQEKLTIGEIAIFFGKSEDAVRGWIRKGLKATLVPGEAGRYASFVVERSDLVQYIQEVGLRRRVHVQVPQYEMNRTDLKSIDLTYIQEKDPALAKNLAFLASDEMVWVRVTRKEVGPSLPMGDLTIEGTHSYLIDGVVVHNSGGNVTLRVLENLLINRISQCEEFITEWMLPKIRAFYGLGECKIKHKDFKMADDVQQKQIAMNLRQTGTISDKTVMEELDFDYEKELRQKAKESDDRLTQQKKEQIAQAEIQAEIMIINAKAQTRAQIIQQQMMAEAGMGQPQPGAPAEGQPQQGQQQPQQSQQSQQPQESPSVMEMRADHFMKSTSPESQDFALANLQQTNPVLASIIEMKRKRISEGAGAMQPLPAQKPPSRSPEKAVI